MLASHHFLWVTPGLYAQTVSSTYTQKLEKETKNVSVCLLGWLFFDLESKLYSKFCFHLQTTVVTAQYLGIWGHDIQLSTTVTNV
jgi:hypothetical protein